jgi:hypothetical protein
VIPQHPEENENFLKKKLSGINFFIYTSVKEVFVNNIINMDMFKNEIAPNIGKY